VSRFQATSARRTAPVYPDFDLAPLKSAPGVEMEFLEPTDPIRADKVAEFDALIILTSRFQRTSVHPKGRLAVVARFGVGYDTVDVEACTDTGIALVRPKIGAKSIYELRRGDGDIVAMLDAIVNSGAPVMADRTLANVRKALN
jgi:phosphoglycerate dehydrogenase-like enzyme